MNLTNAIDTAPPLTADTVWVWNDSLHGCAAGSLSENARCTHVSHTDAHLDSHATSIHAKMCQVGRDVLHGHSVTVETL